MPMLTSLASTVVAFGLTFQQLVGALLLVLGAVFIVSVVVGAAQFGRWGLTMQKNLPPAWLRLGTGALLMVVGLAVGFVLPPTGQPTPTPTATTAGTLPATVPPTATSAAPANVVYLMNLRPSSGALPHKGVAVIAGMSYQNSIWYDPTQVDPNNYTFTSTWSLGGSYHRFVAWIGMDMVSTYEPANFEVFLDGTRVVTQQVSRNQAAYDLQVGLSGAHQMTLTMVVGDPLYDTPIWGNAQLS